MKEALRRAGWCITLSLLAGSGLLPRAGIASAQSLRLSIPDPSIPAVVSTFDHRGGFTPSNSGVLSRNARQGRLLLSLNDCLRMALERNYNIHLSRESLVQAEAKVTQARSAMLPFLGAEAAYM